MHLQFLGTGSGVPAKHRNVSSMALKLLDEINSVWLFDCGEATQHQILKTNLKPRKIEKIFLTHLHGDHIFGLPGFISSRSFQGGESPLDIYGPKGIRQYVLTSLKLSRSFPSYRLNFHEFDEAGVLFDDDHFKVSCAPLKHNIPSFGFRIEEKDHEGQLDADALKALGIPFGPLFGRLKNKEVVTLEDGRVIDGADYVGEDRPGRVITFIGDTMPHPNSVKLAKNADVLIHESTFSKEHQDLARNYHHSTCIQAAEIAREANVKQLFLNHISSRYNYHEVKEMERDAQQIFKQTILVSDLDEYEIDFSKD